MAPSRAWLEPGRSIQKDISSLAADRVDCSDLVLDAPRDFPNVASRRGTHPLLLHSTVPVATRLHGDVSSHFVSSQRCRMSFRNHIAPPRWVFRSRLHLGRICIEAMNDKAMLLLWLITQPPLLLRQTDSQTVPRSRWTIRRVINSYSKPGERWRRIMPSLIHFVVVASLILFFWSIQRPTSGARLYSQNKDKTSVVWEVGYDHRNTP